MRHLRSTLIGLGLVLLAAACGSNNPPTATADAGKYTSGSFGNASGTSGGAVCGNGVIETGELCDGQQLNNATCASMGYAAGTLFCDPRACSLDTSMCTGTATGGGAGTGG